jgi:hypothetical protein
MAFITSSTTKTLSAYLTQLGRKYVLDGNKEDFQIEYFSLHDDDTNYNLASIKTNNIYNTLPSGFVPDITGDIDSCLKSISYATNVNNNTTLSGSTIIDLNTQKPTVGFIGTDGNINSRILNIGFTQSAPLTINTISTVNPTTVLLNISLSLPENETDAVKTTEINNSSVKLSILSQSNFFTNVKINGKDESDIIIMTSSTINVPVTLQRSNVALQTGTVTAKLEIQIEPYRSFLNSTSNTTFTIQTTITSSNNQSSQ